MPDHVLITPIGRSPGAVTGAYYALSDEDEGLGIPIKKVITVGTKDELTRASQKYVDDFFKLDEVNIQHIPKRIKTSELNKDSTIAYQKLFEEILEEHAGYTIHLCITPGLSGMSGLAVLATNFHRAEHMYHYWAPTKIAEAYVINDLDNNLPEIDNAEVLNCVGLNPFKVENEGDKPEYNLIELPFVSLYRLAPIIDTYLRSEGTQYPDVDTVWHYLSTLPKEKLKAFEYIPPAVVEKLVALVHEDFESLTSNEQLKLEIQMLEILSDYHITNKELRRQIWEALKQASNKENLKQDFEKMHSPRSDFAKQLAYDVFINVLANVVVEGSKVAIGIN